MLDKENRRWLRQLLGKSVCFDEPMRQRTYFRIGGPADAWVEPQSASQLKVILEWAQRQTIPYLMIGGGSNLLVRDGGIRGLVIHLGHMATGVTWAHKGRKMIISAGAGISTKHICTLALKQGWQGMNFALGIPGTLGGAILMNAGTAHGCMADVVEKVTVMTAEGEQVVLQRQSLEYRYRRLRLPEGAGRSAVVETGEPGAHSHPGAQMDAGAGQKTAILGAKCRMLFQESVRRSTGRPADRCGWAERCGRW